MMTLHAPPTNQRFVEFRRKYPPIAGGSARTYMAFNGPMPTTSPPTKVTTGTSTKTLMQIETGTVTGLRVIEWGISFDGYAAATPIECELLTTGSVGATVTAYTLSTDIVKMNGPNDAASSIAGGGYTSTSEGSITATREGDLQMVAPTNGYLKQFPLGREFEVPVSTYLRVRVTAGTAVNAYCYVVWEE